MIDIRSPSFIAASEELDKLSRQIHREYQKQLTMLIEEQFVDCVKQAVACGAFTQLVSPNNRYGMVFTPYSECERLKARVERLEAELRMHKIEIPTDSVQF